MRALARRTTLAAILTIVFVAFAGASAQAATCTSCTWSGGGASTSSNWSNGANWAGGNAPSSSVTSLSFPGTVTCSMGAPPDPCQSNNDISGGVSTGTFTVDLTTGYSIFGNGITLGSGGLHGTASNCGSNNSTPFMQIPIALSATQTWNLPGCPNGSSGFASLELFGAVTGSQALTVNMGNGANLGLTNVNVGNSSFAGGGIFAGGFVSLSSGRFGSASLNGSSGNPVAFNGVGFGVFSNATTAALSMTAGFFQLGGQGQSPMPILTVNGGASFDSTSSYGTVINQAGTTPGTDYSQLSASGTVSLGGNLNVEGADPSTGNCPTLHVGDVDTLITTSGSRTGTFSNAPDGSTMQLQCFGGTPATVRINYTSNSVTATVLTAGSSAVLTTTSLSANPQSPVTNQGDTLTANVTASDGSTPTGTVGFTDNGNQIPGCSTQPVDSSGNATCQASFGAGTQNLVATYTPSNGSNYAGSSGPDSITVGKDATGTTVTSSNSSPSPGQSVTYTATVTPAHTGPVSPSGSVSFSDNGSQISGCSSQSLAQGNTSSTATCTTSYSSGGSHSITASYGGDSNFTGSTSSPQTVTVQPAPAISATTQTAASITSISAVLNGMIDTNGAAVTWQFQFGTSTNYNQGTPIQTITAGHGTVPVSWQLSNLQPNTLYHFRLVAMTGSASQSVTSFGSSLTFTTNATGKLVLSFSRLTVIGGLTSIRLKCVSRLMCKGRFSITIKAHIGKHPATVLCNTTHFKIKARKAKTIKAVKISAACMSRLHQAGSHRIKARFTLIPTTGQFGIIETITLILG